MMFEPSVTHRLLRASAGTGKTYQLVEAYADLVLHQGLRPGQIVAITFTRKAAMELKLRIRARLRAAGVPQAVLSELARAPLSNFHGLALQLLRGAGLQADFAAGSHVLGEAGEDAVLFGHACEAAWFGGDADVAAAVQTLAPHFSVDNELPPALWGALGRAREDGTPVVQQLLGTPNPAAVQASAHGQLLALRQRLLAALPEMSGKAVEKLRAFAEVLPPEADAPVAGWQATWRAMFKQIDRRGKLGDIYSKDDQAVLAEALEDPLAEAHSAALAPSLGLLVERAWESYTQAKRQRRSVDFADIIESVVRLLNERPDLHRAVRERFAAVLVDEAQDTNRLQRQLVHLLAGLEGPAANEVPPARLFVVGDWKQSIYTFRGADPQSFALFADDLRQRGGAEATLSISRRSGPRLVHGINHLGSHALGDAYEPLEPLPHGDDRSRMTWLNIEAPPDFTDMPRALLEARGITQFVHGRLQEGAKPGDFAVLMATMTTAPLTARALMDAGIPAVLGGGGGLYEQTEMVDVLALLSWLVDPRDRLSAAVALRSPLFGLSDSTLLALLRSDGRRPLDDLRSGTVTVEVAGEAASLARCAALLPPLVQAAHTLGAAAMLEFADNALHMRAVYLALESGEQRLANIHRLFELAARADAVHGNHVGRFVREQQGRAQRGGEPLAAMPASARRAVVLSSVHQSKGLQYPVVIMAGLGRKARQDTASLRYCSDAGLVFRPRLGQQSLKTARWRGAQTRASEVQQGELRRLLYVAITRAEQEVVFAAPQPLGNAGFAQLLQPWMPQAQQAGVLSCQSIRVQTEPLPPLAAATAPALAQPLPLSAPEGSRFEITVTDLSRWHQPPVAPAWRPGPAWSSNDSQGQTDPPLDPLGRGRLAHEVLAVLERCPQAPSVSQFVTDALHVAGYDPTADRRVAEVAADVQAFLQSRLGQVLLSLSPDERRHELPFCATFDAKPHTATLRGQLDLLYWDAEGPVIVDYKHAHAGRSTDVESYLLQLDAYALAVAQLCNVTTDIRTRLVFLRDRAEPHAHLATRARQDAVRKLVTRYVNSRAIWQPASARLLDVPPPSC